MELRRIHHVAFAHESANEAHAILSSVLGLEITATEAGAGLLERILPVGDGSVQTLEAVGPGIIERFTSRRGDALHHIAFEVDDVTDAVRELHDRGVEMIDSEPRPGGDGTLVAFINPSSTAGLLIELVQVPPR
ncbi:MAG: VOC family protein [Acidimicrobiales bacterium]|nr:VOC family protein [Acidimicrobiales bacterium]